MIYFNKSLSAILLSSSRLVLISHHSLSIRLGHLSFSSSRSFFFPLLLHRVRIVVRRRLFVQDILNRAIIYLAFAIDAGDDRSEFHEDGPRAVSRWMRVDFRAIFIVRFQSNKTAARWFQDRNQGRNLEDKRWVFYWPDRLVSFLFVGLFLWSTSRSLDRIHAIYNTPIILQIIYLTTLGFILDCFPWSRRLPSRRGLGVHSSRANEWFISAISVSRFFFSLFRGNRAIDAYTRGS